MCHPECELCLCPISSQPTTSRHNTYQLPWNEHQTPSKPCIKQNMWKQTRYHFTENKHYLRATLFHNHTMTQHGVCLHWRFLLYSKFLKMTTQNSCAAWISSGAEKFGIDWSWQPALTYIYVSCLCQHCAMHFGDRLYSLYEQNRWDKKRWVGVTWITTHVFACRMVLVDTG